MHAEDCNIAASSAFPRGSAAAGCYWRWTVRVLLVWLILFSWCLIVSVGLTMRHTNSIAHANVQVQRWSAEWNALYCSLSSCGMLNIFVNNYMDGDNLRDSHHSSNTICLRRTRLPILLLFISLRFVAGIVIVMNLCASSVNWNKRERCHAVLGAMQLQRASVPSFCFIAGCELHKRLVCGRTWIGCVIIC